MSILAYIAGTISIIASIDVDAVAIGSYSSFFIGVFFIGVFFICVGWYDGKRR